MIQIESDGEEEGDDEEEVGIDDEVEPAAGGGSELVKEAQGYTLHLSSNLKPAIAAFLKEGLALCGEV